MFNKEIQAIIRKRVHEIVPEVKASKLIKRRRDRSSPTSQSHLTVSSLEYNFSTLMEHNQEKKYLGGGYGKVKKGYNTLMGNKRMILYAIKIYKILKEHTLKDREILAGRESKFHELFGNPCSWSTIGEKVYLIMPWILGINLREHQEGIACEFKKSGTTTFKIQDRLISSVSYFLQTIVLHLLGMIWGDTKPENIMLNLKMGSEGVDFDAIRFEGDSGACSRAYLPPRLISILNEKTISYAEKHIMVAESYQQADDIFILGVTLALWIPELFEVILSPTLNNDEKPPYSPPEIKVKKDAVLPKDHWLVELITKMTHEDPEQRPTAEACFQEISRNLSSNYGCSLESNSLYELGINRVAVIKKRIRELMIDELLIAIRNNDLNGVTTILNQYPDLVNGIGEGGKSPLTAALLHPSSEMGDLFLKRGADVLEIKTSEFKGDVVAKINHHKIMHLIKAVKNAPESELKTILSKTKDLINFPTQDGDYALLSALTISDSSSKKIKIRLLLENGADIFVPDQKGKCALIHIMEKKDWAVLDAVLSVKPELLNESVSIFSSGNTLFNEAIKNKDYKMLAVLSRHLSEYFHQNSLNPFNILPKIPISLLSNLINKATRPQISLFIENFCWNLERLEKPDSSYRNKGKTIDYQKIQVLISVLKKTKSSIDSLTATSEDPTQLFCAKQQLMAAFQKFNSITSTEQTDINHVASNLSILCSMGIFYEKPRELTAVCVEGNRLITSLTNQFIEDKEHRPSTSASVESISESTSFFQARWEKIRPKLHKQLKKADEKAIKSFLQDLSDDLNRLSDLLGQGLDSYTEVIEGLAKLLKCWLEYDTAILANPDKICAEIGGYFETADLYSCSQILSKSVLGAFPALFGAKRTPTIGGPTEESKPVRFHFFT
jgi:serine/threonine protein kinase